MEFTDEDSSVARLQLQVVGAFAEWEAQEKRIKMKQGIAVQQNTGDKYHRD